MTNSIRSLIIENILKRSKQNMCRLIWEFHLLQDFQMRLAFNYFRQLIVSLNWYVFIQLSIQFWLFLFAFNWSKVQRLCNWRIGWVWRYLDWRLKSTIKSGLMKYSQIFRHHYLKFTVISIQFHYKQNSTQVKSVKS